MLSWITDTIVGWTWNGLLAIFLFWVPMLLCIFGYTVRTARNYMNDKERLSDYAEEMAEYVKKKNKNPDAYIATPMTYYPTDTIGSLVGRAVVSLIPIANLWAAMFDVAPELFKRFFEWIGDVLNIPLVPGPKKQKEK